MVRDRLDDQFVEMPVILAIERRLLDAEQKFGFLAADRLSALPGGDQDALA
jgi:hypothetical protein